jgi:hypothetical protein
MTNESGSKLDVDVRMLQAGGVVGGVGIMLFWAGCTVAGVALTKAFRSWIRQLEKSPGAMAGDKYSQARTASNAAMRAWREARPVNGSAMSR